MLHRASRVLFRGTTRATQQSRLGGSGGAKRNHSSKVDGATKGGSGGNLGKQSKVRQQMNRAQVVTQLGGALSQTVFLDLLLFGALDDDGT
ncbi:hypothetical protein BASA81_009859 [Batrachochytrium salamandrivorans]|nr:hypothetical protein BASA81_009859 [Batrachochytrium salamandrivorans]